MEQAIVTGATGYIGKAVVKELLDKGLKVLAIGRKSKSYINKFSIFQKENIEYIQLDMENIQLLPKRMEEIKWIPNQSCIFYNFAWEGDNSLTDGTFEDQLKNATYASNAIIVAKIIGCNKFINCGTLEETFAEKYLNKIWKTKEYHSNQGYYAIAKLASRDMCKLNAYLHKIDYIHTRLSVFLDCNLDYNGYIQKTLKQILSGNSFDEPLNKQLFDIISLEDGAKAYYLLGKLGENKMDYFIGSGYPNTLKNYFIMFSDMCGYDIATNKEKNNFTNDLLLTPEDFSISQLQNQTGFTLSKKIQDIFSSIIKK